MAQPERPGGHKGTPEDGRADGRTGRRTDGRTDGWSARARRNPQWTELDGQQQQQQQHTTNSSTNGECFAERLWSVAGLSAAGGPFGCGARPGATTHGPLRPKMLYDLDPINRSTGGLGVRFVAAPGPAPQLLDMKFQFHQHRGPFGEAEVLREN